jgi:hypothetical protein
MKLLLHVLIVCIKVNDPKNEMSKYGFSCCYCWTQTARMVCILLGAEGCSDDVISKRSIKKGVKTFSQTSVISPPIWWLLCQTAVQMDWYYTSCNWAKDGRCCLNSNMAQQELKNKVLTSKQSLAFPFWYTMNSIPFLLYTAKEFWFE